MDHVRLYASSPGTKDHSGVYWDFKRFVDRRGDWSDWIVRLSFRGMEEWPFKENSREVLAQLRGRLTGLMEIHASMGEPLDRDFKVELILREDVFVEWR